ncbi:restriction endonuclease subunit S [Halomonas sp. LR3S48]|uniref:restriction endonuclease subunit S n=1 Tax=Halomonas sp. LR3S48 TaxID=2982694 RepID=UPI0021E41C19|nr:restriction endonuclease subunit S [Halomonas sp. LR3S48]UYG05057.1 restriction endonuclease subunit S [Halomonas sp. LR3S48]
MSEWVLPEGWGEAVVTDIAGFVRGVTFKKAEAIAYPEVGYVPIIRANNIQNSKLILDDLVYAPEDKVSDSQRIKAGDVVVAMSSGSRKVVGKTASANKDWEGAFGAFCGVFRPSKHMSSSYFGYYFGTQEYRAKASSLAAGANINNLKASHFDQILVPIPGLEEQKDIADKLDDLLAQVNNLKARLDAIPAILKRFRQSVLAAAVSGRLTAEWRVGKDLDPVTVKPNEKLPVVGESDYYGASIETWRWLRFGSVVRLVNGDRGRNYPNKSDYVEHGMPFINTGHIEPDGTLSLARMNYISQDKYESLGGGKTQPGDLVYCLRGATMGKTARVDFEVGAIASSLVIVRPGACIVRKFAYYYLISPVAEKMIKKYDNGSAQPNLSAKSLASYSLQLPPIEEQSEIVRRVDQLFALADQIEQQVKNAQARVDKLTQSILAKAFRGELTAEWRAANPELISGENSAEALLKRIKAEKARQKPAGRGRGKKPAYAGQSA